MRMLLVIVIAILGYCSFTYAADKPVIERHHFKEWEKEIGFAAVTRVDKTLYISGVACAGANMQAAVTTCYQQLTQILQKFNVGTDAIVKETIYATDIKALIKAIPDRKTFFKHAQYPAATWVQVSRLFQEQHLLEIELIVQVK